MASTRWVVNKIRTQTICPMVLTKQDLVMIIITIISFIISSRASDSTNPYPANSAPPWCLFSRPFTLFVSDFYFFFASNQIRNVLWPPSVIHTTQATLPHRQYLCYSCFIRVQSITYLVFRTLRHNGSSMYPIKFSTAPLISHLRSSQPPLHLIHYSQTFAQYITVLSAKVLHILILVSFLICVLHNVKINWFVAWLPCKTFTMIDSNNEIRPQTVELPPADWNLELEYTKLITIK